MSLKSHEFTVVLIVLSFVLLSCGNEHEKQATQKPESNLSVATGIPNSLSQSSFVEQELALHNDSLNVPLRLKLASDYYSMKQMEKALYHNQIVLSIDKANPQAIYNLGNLYYDLNQNEKAIYYYERLLETYPKNCNVRCDLATCYMRLNNDEKSLKLLRENLNYDNTHLQSHYNLAMLMQKTGKSAEAAKEMEIFNKLSSEKSADR